MALLAPVTPENTTKPGHWGWVGAAVGSFFPLPLLGTALGAWLGYRYGANKRDEEIESGFKEARSPSLLNSGILSGMFKGNLIGIALGVATVIGILAITGGIGAALALAAGTAPINGAALAAVPGAITAGLAANVVVFGSTIYGAFKGAHTRKQELKRDHADALAYSMSHQQARTATEPMRQPAREQERGESPAPEKEAEERRSSQVDMVLRRRAEAAREASQTGARLA